MAPGNFEDEVNEACQPSQWSPVITQAFALYRVLFLLQFISSGIFGK